MPTFRFDRHRFDSRTGEIVRPDGSVARLQPQPAEVLTLLLERAPALVTRSELQARIWADTKVEFDQGINFCVRQIREALEESAADPRFVETLPRRGYRIIVDVAEEGGVGDAAEAAVDGAVAEDDVTRAAEESTHGAGPAARRRALPLALAGAAGLALLAVVVLRDVRSDPAPAGAPAADRVRIAVLPFREGAGASPTADGLALAEAVTTALTREMRLGVVGPASTRPYTGDRSGTSVVGTELAVDYVLSGAIEPRGDSTLFFGQLVRVADLEHVWAERVMLEGGPTAGIPAAAERAAARVRDFLAARDAGRTAKGIAWERTGSGPAVVLVHGSNLDRRAWTEEARLLREHRTVVRYDLRGHGASAGADAPYSDVADLVAVLDDAGVARADLVGLSAGARVALDAAVEHPDRVGALVLASPTVSGYRPSPEERPSFAPALGEALAAGDHARAADLLLETPVFRVPGPTGAWVARMVRENDRVWRIDPSFPEAPDPPAVERLASVSARVLVLVGSDDLLAVRRQAELLGRELPDARVETVPGGGHLLNVTDPVPFRAAVFPFLGVPAPARP